MSGAPIVSLRNLKVKNKGFVVDIKSEDSDVKPFVDAVRNHADRERDALGFLPAPVYDDAAARGNLLVALVTTNREYGGHVLFGGTFPHARIFQLFVVEHFRNKGVAQELITHLTKMLEEYGYLSVSATVAEDLPANGFWEKIGFAIVRRRPGGAARNRLLNVRIRQLNTPTLFDAQLPAAADLGLIEQLGAQPAVYAIDLNVFWDIIKGRPRSEYAADVIGAAFNKLIQIVVAEEFINELQRSSKATPTDPALEFAMQFPTLPEPEPIVLQQLLDELGRLIFPNRLSRGNLSLQDRSDLVHLATAIHHSATGFVTSDDTLLKVQDPLYKRYGIFVLHVKNFAALVKSSQMRMPAISVQLSSDTLRVWDRVSGHSQAIRAFLDSFSTPTMLREDFLAREVVSSGRKRAIVTSGSDIVCLASWDAAAGLQNRADVRLVANEEHPAAEAALECIIGAVCSDASHVAPVLLRLYLPSGHVMAEKVAFVYGFRTVGGPRVDDVILQKVCVGRPIYAANWPKMRAVLQVVSGVSFPESLPTFVAHDQLISLRTADGVSRDVKLTDLERLLAPTLIVLPGRPANIVPIRRGYADQLLGASRQLSLLPGREAMLFSERVYFSAPRNFNLFKVGVPLLFYESGRDGGRASVTACARIVHTKVLRKSDIPRVMLRHGVLEIDDFDQLTATDLVSAATFGNVMVLDQSVSLNRLRELRCVDASNLVCPRQISDQQLIDVLVEGFARA